jgi:hypothetical protein
MTKWQICQTFADIMGLPLDKMMPFIPSEEPKDGTIRPYDCHLDTSALQKLGIDVGTVDFRTWWYAVPTRTFRGTLILVTGDVKSAHFDEHHIPCGAACGVHLT